MVNNAMLLIISSEFMPFWISDDKSTFYNYAKHFYDYCGLLTICKVMKVGFITKIIQYFPG